MRINRNPSRIRHAASREHGFAMIIALLVLFVSSLLVVAVFAAANGDIKLTHTDTNQKKAYYAALAGLAAYKYQLDANPNYWTKCPSIAKTKVIGASDEEYSVETVPSEKHNRAECENEHKQAAIIEESQSAEGTFRVASTGVAGAGQPGEEKRTIVATFTHPGFLDYVYFTNYEILDPAAQNPEPTECEHYYAYRKANNLVTKCGTIEFASGDKVKGPLHTNDAAAICAEGGSEPTFGRSSADKIEMNGGHYAAGGSCSNSPDFVGTFTEEGPTLTPPETDNELLEGAGYKFKGKTLVELKSGNPNTMTVTTYTNGTANTPETKPFPSNGVIYIENAESGCNIKYTPFNPTYSGDTQCGNVYIHGTYTESLTVAAANDVIINGNLTTSAESSGEPTGGATLGLIATNFVRVYHPVEQEYPVSTYTPTTEEPVGSPPEKCGTWIERTGTTNSSKTTEITGITTTGLKTGEEVGSTTAGVFNAGTTITEVKTGALKISAAAKKFATYTLTFYKKSTTLEYKTGIKKCVEKTIRSGYEYVEAENLAHAKCSGEDTYGGEGKCEYTNKAGKCDAENTTAAKDPFGWGTIVPTIDAAILSTDHSFIVDNYDCGKHIGELTVWGSIAQFWRGPVGTGGTSSGTGYTKNYNYDDRLTSEQPPDFLSPNTTSWKLSRVTAAPNSFSG